MSIVRKIKRALRGEVDAKTAALEVLRRTKASLEHKRERSRIEQGASVAAKLHAPFATLSENQLLDHFRNRSQPVFLPGFNASSVVNTQQRQLFPQETDELLASAERILLDHAWSILGLGLTKFGDTIDWNRDPVSGIQWPLQFHSDLNLFRADGSDVRVLWELNRLQHFITLARAFALTSDDRFTAEFVRQLESWRSQNPYGYGANWNCAMEVALRGINLLGAFQIFLRSELFNGTVLASLLSLFEQHGRFIRQNLEFSYIATSNHYLSDVVGLTWLGIMLPELEEAGAWRDFGLREMLREMDKQVLSDGADFESSTGYHRFVVELFLYTFVLCRENGIAIDQRYWDKLHAMLSYVRGYVRPDGRAPLIGDSDGGQVFPIRPRDADDHSYILALGAVAFKDRDLVHADAALPEEVLWVFGENGVREFKSYESAGEWCSASFPSAGFYHLRNQDLALNMNASGAGINGRGSHGHNDALSVEVSACGVAFVVDPGTYVYTADLGERHRFRSTAYHSTIEIDGVEQNTIDEQSPFVIGSEAGPKMSLWERGAEVDRVSAEHYGYQRLPEPVRHKRTVTFHKQGRWWLIEDEFAGSGKHKFAARFHMNSGLDVSLAGDTSVWAYDRISGAKLLIGSLDLLDEVEFENQFTSRNYYQKSPSVTVCWRFEAEVPLKVRWILLPACDIDGQDETQINLRLEQAESFIESDGRDHRSGVLTN